MDGVNGMSESDWRKSFIGVAETMLRYTDSVLQLTEAFEVLATELKAQHEKLCSVLEPARDQEIDGLFNDGL